MSPDKTLYFRNAQIINVFNFTFVSIKSLDLIGTLKWHDVVLETLWLLLYYFFVLDTKVRFTNVLLQSHEAGFKSRESESTLWKGLKTSCSSCWKLLSSICNNSIRFFQCSGCFDTDTLSTFKCGYFKAHPVSSVWKSPIIILSISVSSLCSHSNTLTSADAYLHTNTQSAHTCLISLQCQWF